MEWIQQMGAVAGVLGLLGAALWWLRSRGMVAPLGRRKAGGTLEALERLPLAPQVTLHLVRAGERRLLVAVTPGGCTLIERLPETGCESVQ